MKINISNSYKTPVSAAGEYLFIRGAVGDVDVTFTLSDREQTVTMGQGETLHISFDGLAFQARGSSQQIDVRMGFGRYTPPMSSIASSVVEQIRQPVEISGISSNVRVGNFPENQAVTVTNQPENQLVTVDNFPEDQAVTVTNQPENQLVTVDNFPELQQVAVSNFPENQMVTANFSADAAKLFSKPSVIRILMTSGSGVVYVVPPGKVAEITLNSISVNIVNGGVGSISFLTVGGTSVGRVSVSSGDLPGDYFDSGGFKSSDGGMFKGECTLVENEKIRMDGAPSAWFFVVTVREYDE